MNLRNILLGIGLVFVLAGVVLLISWFGSAKKPVESAQLPQETRAAVLVADRDIPVGTFLQEGDLKDANWRQLAAGEEVHPGNLQRGQVSKTEFVGAISRRDFAKGESLIASDFVKPGDRRFLAATLKPGSRAVTIFVDAEKSAAGLVLPGDYVDVVLTQTFDKKSSDIGHNTVGETVLRDVRVIAVDQSLSPQPGPTPASLGANSASSRIPLTVTLEVVRQQAEKLLVAAQLGKFQLAVLPLDRAGAAPDDENVKTKPVWASDVSPALGEEQAANVVAPPSDKPPPPLGEKPPSAQGAAQQSPSTPACPSLTTGSTLAVNVRCPPENFTAVPAAAAPRL